MAVTSERLMFHRKPKNCNDLKSSESQLTASHLVIFFNDFLCMLVSICNRI